MKRLNLKRNVKVSEGTKFKIQVIFILIVLALIYIATPHCTQATKNVVKFLYELDEEYLNRFWMGLLSLVSMITILFGKSKNQK